MNNKSDNLILLVDDDPSVLASLAMLLKQNGFNVLQAKDPNSALKIINSENVCLVLQDMNFDRSTSGEEGMQLLDDIRDIEPNLPVILMTAWGSIDLAVSGMRAGASDFISKPWDNQALLRRIETIIGLGSQKKQQIQTRSQLEQQFDFSKIVGESPAILQTLSTIARICKTDASVLILGESGTGKEVIADAIHQNSLRKDASLVKVNLGGITPSLFESEMFGHVKGAFTDAKSDRKGRFSAANGGTLFLDEIGEMDKSSQVKLLRVLQDQNFQMVGSSNNTCVDVRIISATNQDLENMVAEELFREDLFYRINLITLTLPPLRDRTEDIPLLASHHLNRVSHLYGIEKASISQSAIAWLQQQNWPGNIRQLCQTLERVILMTGKTNLDIEDFSIGNVEKKRNQNSEGFSDNMTLEAMEKVMIEKALKAHQGNISKVAAVLGVSRAALYRRLDKHGIQS